jgi:DNA ligase D-like protein (predicted ligase)
MRPSKILTPPRQAGYLAERKFDGSRVLAYIGKDGQVLMNRRGVDKSEQFPEFKQLQNQLKFKSFVVLDGEVVHLTNAKDSFKDLASREHLKDRDVIIQKSKKEPLTYIVFDILEVDGKNLKSLPLKERKKLLDDVVPDNLKRVREIKTSKDLEKFTAKLKKMGVEGVVFKKEDSGYRGGQTKDWLKLKFKKENDVAIVGYTPGTGKRKGQFGSLVMAVRKGNRYKYKGNVGTGFDEKKLKKITKKLKALETSRRPNLENGVPKDTKWVRPWSARVKYMKEGSQGRYREPVFVAQRTDISPLQTHA